MSYIYLTSLALYSSALQQSVGLPIRDTCTLQAIAVYRLMYVYKYVVHRVVASWLLIIPSVNQDANICPLSILFRLHTDFHSPCSDEPEDIYDDSIALVDDLYEELVSESTDNTKAIFHC